MTHVESIISLVPNPGWPHLGSVGPRLFTTLSPRVILFETTLGFGHNEDIYAFTWICLPYVGIITVCMCVSLVELPFHMVMGWILALECMLSDACGLLQLCPI
jgi:hypothetical protein